MSDLDIHTVAVCTAYAQLLCAAREAYNPNSRFGMDCAAALTDAAWTLSQAAPGTSGPYLDTIKKVMEIDRDVTDPHVVLMRASVAVDNERAD